MTEILSGASGGSGSGSKRSQSRITGSNETPFLGNGKPQNTLSTKKRPAGYKNDYQKFVKRNYQGNYLTSQKNHLPPKAHETPVNVHNNKLTVPPKILGSPATIHSLHENEPYIYYPRTKSEEFMPTKEMLDIYEQFSRQDSKSPPRCEGQSGASKIKIITKYKM